MLPRILGGFDMHPNVSVIDVTSSVMRSRALSNRQLSIQRVANGADCTAGVSKDLDEPPSTALVRLRLAVAELFHAVRNALQDEHESAQECLERACELLKLEPSPTHLPAAPRDRAVMPTRGGLAPWQIREVTLHIEKHLDARVTIKDLATLVRLSSYHFCRTFKVSFGDSPHGYLMRRRVERAQGLMLSSKMPLGQIAVVCGLADQAHFNKLFVRFVGENPGAWRRARAIAPREVDGHLHA
jgi:AraC family transcriptional regulator